MKESALCPRLSKAMELVGKRWTALIIYQLLEGPQRFNAIEAALPISGRLLSERLKELEKEGIVETTKGNFGVTSAQDLIMKYRETLLNIEQLIIHDKRIAELFMLIY